MDEGKRRGDGSDNLYKRGSHIIPERSLVRVWTVRRLAKITCIVYVSKELDASTCLEERCIVSSAPIGIQ